MYRCRMERMWVRALESPDPRRSDVLRAGVGGGRANLELLAHVRVGADVDEQVAAFAHGEAPARVPTGRDVGDHGVHRTAEPQPVGGEANPEDGRRAGEEQSRIHEGDS